VDLKPGHDLFRPHPAIVSKSPIAWVNPGGAPSVLPWQ